jgi:hypothetical protein
MLRTSSGVRPEAWTDSDSGWLGAVSWEATMPGARLARGTRRGRPAYVSRGPVAALAGWAGAGVGSGA